MSTHGSCSALAGGAFQLRGSTGRLGSFSRNRSFGSTGSFAAALRREASGAVSTSSFVGRSDLSHSGGEVCNILEHHDSVTDVCYEAGLA